MKRILLFFTIPYMLFSEIHFSLGSSALGELDEETLISVEDNLYGGLFWEVSSNRLGMGMTYDLTFKHEESDSDLVDTDWWIDWNAAIDFNYHILGNNNIMDIFMGYSIGVNSTQKLYWYDRIESGWEETEPGIYTYESENSYKNGQATEIINLYGQINSGVSIFLDKFFVGTKVHYRVMQMGLFKDSEKAENINPLSASLNIGFRF